MERDPALAPHGAAEAIAAAIGHEVGNWLAAIRLEAELLDEDLGRRELAAASVEIDELCARSAALLALLRPLLASPPARPGRADPRSVVETVRASLVDQGLRGVRLEVELRGELVPVRADSHVLHPLLMTLAFGALEAARPNGLVRLAARPADEALTFVVEDTAVAVESVHGWRSRPLCGRSLGWATAEAIVAKLGGRVGVSAMDPGTRVELRLPIVRP